MIIKLSYLMNGLHDPIDPRVSADSFVLWVYEDDFEIFVGRVLVDPV